MTSLINNLSCGKLDAAAAAMRAEGAHRYGSYVKDKASWDTYGRSNLCSTSLNRIYGGAADCDLCGLIQQETVTRPDYTKYIGGECGNCYTGGADQMILGYPAGPRGFAYCPSAAAVQAVDCNSLGCSGAREACARAKTPRTDTKTGHFTLSGPQTRN